jgi:hypothetical protein
MTLLPLIEYNYTSMYSLPKVILRGKTEAENGDSGTPNIITIVPIICKSVFAYLRGIHEVNSNIKRCAAMEIHKGCTLFVD